MTVGMNAILARANSFRGPLRDKVKAEIIAYIHNPEPTKEQWDSLSHIIVQKGAISIWKAVVAIDPSFQTQVENKVVDPEVRWQRVPDGFTVARAIREATKEVK